MVITTKSLYSKPLSITPKMLVPPYRSIEAPPLTIPLEISLHVKNIVGHQRRNLVFRFFQVFTNEHDLLLVGETLEAFIFQVEIGVLIFMMFYEF